MTRWRRFVRDYKQRIDVCEATSPWAAYFYAASATDRILKRTLILS